MKIHSLAGVGAAPLHTEILGKLREIRWNPLGI